MTRRNRPSILTPGPQTHAGSNRGPARATGYVLAAIVVLFATVAAAKDAFVIDKLLVGLHQDKDLNSAIVKVLPTGTRLEVLTQEGELAEVKDPDGVTGWVDVAYLMDEPPAQSRIDTLEKEKAELEEQLAAAREGQGESASGAASSELNAKVEQLTRENTELKGKLSAGMQKETDLAAQLKEIKSKLASTASGEHDLRVLELEEEIQSLRRDLEEAGQANKALETRLAERSNDALPTVNISGFSNIAVGIIVFALLACFGAGVWFMDWQHRRRHGGFRV